MLLSATPEEYSCIIHISLTLFCLTFSYFILVERLENKKKDHLHIKLQKIILQNNE